MMTHRLRNIVVAVTLALVAALLTMYYVTNYQQNVRQDETNVPVWVAAHDIPVGTSGADLTRKGLLEESEVVRRSVVPGAISDPTQLEGLVAKEAIFAGEQVTTRRFSTKEQRGISARLTGTERAISVPGDKNQLLVGTLKAGDRVDVVAAWGSDSAQVTGPQEGAAAVSRIILRDLLVLKAPSAVSSGDALASSKESHAVMLVVSDRNVQKLYWMHKFGSWHLELRPAADATDSPENVESSLTLLREGVSAKQLAEAFVRTDIFGGVTP
jgi:Flp pilus assembly protein CpaB